MVLREIRRRLLACFSGHETPRYTKGMSNVKEQIEDAGRVARFSVGELIPQLQILSMLHNEQGREVLRQSAEYLEQYAEILEA